MATQNEHGRLIATAAKAALAPIGCVRRAQSRVWLSDQRYWAIMIEFQPSGFSKGSYLSVGASWLWYDRGNGGLAFNVGNRVEDAGFIQFENAEQFRPLIEKMAARAVAEVLALRAKFPSIDAISRFLNAAPDTGDLRRIHPRYRGGAQWRIRSIAPRVRTDTRLPHPLRLGDRAQVRGSDSCYASRRSGSISRSGSPDNRSKPDEEPPSANLRLPRGVGIERRHDAEIAIDGRQQHRAVAARALDVSHVASIVLQGPTLS
jgi:hypothetical protein